MSGKLKRLFQCIAVGVSLFYLSWAPDAAPDWARPLLVLMVWTAVVLTVYSGVAYVRTAIQLLRG
jgi:phosphatidylglycerophosphate synthase